MRAPLDRLRHALAFEIVALVLIIPLGAAAFHLPMGDAAAVGLASAAITTLWNMAYNYLFDLGLRRLTGNTRKSLGLRLLHAILFEAGLLTVLMPFLAWYLGISLWQALVMDIAFALFYLAYAFAFNWAYDRLFPLPEWSRAERAG